METNVLLYLPMLSELTGYLECLQRAEEKTPAWRQ